MGPLGPVAATHSPDTCCRVSATALPNFSYLPQTRLCCGNYAKTPKPAKKPLGHLSRHNGLHTRRAYIYTF